MKRALAVLVTFVGLLSASAQAAPISPNLQTPAVTSSSDQVQKVDYYYGGYYRPWGYRRWGYRRWGYRPYPYWGYRRYGYGYGYRPWGYRGWY